MRRKKRCLGVLLTVMLCICPVAACGDGGRQTIVSGKYYHPDAEVQEDAAASAADAAGDAAGADDTESDEPQEAKELGRDQFLITNHDMQGQCLILEQIATGKQYMYNYSSLTRFLDKYGNRAAVVSFEPGRVIRVGDKDTQGKLLEAQLSPQVWEYPDVTRYSIDEEHGVFWIADNAYTFDEALFVHADGERERLADLTAGIDTLRIVGIDKELLSVSVTTGHGELALENTGVFEGSYIQVGSDICEEVTKDMSMEVPEGTYTVAVANNGYGGSTEVEIRRGERTVLDLDTLKGEGPKYGSILFAVDVVGAVLRVDGNVIDYSQAVSLQYGAHVLSVSASGYDVLSKRLYVNSPTATIIISLTGEDDSVATNGQTGTSGTTGSSEAASGTGTTTPEPGSLAGSLAGGGSSAGTTASVTDDVTGQAELNAIVSGLLDESGTSRSDYLSTILDVIGDLVDDEDE